MGKTYDYSAWVTLQARLAAPVAFIHGFMIEPDPAGGWIPWPVGALQASVPVCKTRAEAITWAQEHDADAATIGPRATSENLSARASTWQRHGREDQARWWGTLGLLRDYRGPQPVYVERPAQPAAARMIGRQAPALA